MTNPKDTIQQIGGAESKKNELLKRILFTLFCLAVFRVGTQITVPGVDLLSMEQFFGSISNTALGFYNRFTGGALERFSIFALGVMPYITSSIIFSLLALSFPYFAELQKETDGRKKISQWTRYFSVVLCVFQGYGLTVMMESSTGVTGTSIVIDPGLGFKATAILTMTAGSLFVMWLGERITEKGIGNGVSLIIFAGIAAGIPSAFRGTYNLFMNNEISFLAIVAILVIILLSFWFVVFIERSYRKVPVHYAKRVVNNRVYGGQVSHLPVKLNVSGIMPPIFAYALLSIPGTITQFNLTANIPDSLSLLKTILESFQAAMNPGSNLYTLVLIGLIIFFSFFYATLQFRAKDISENLQKNGGFLPGIRPGLKTEEFLTSVVNKLALVGGVYVSLICVLPTILLVNFNVPFFFGGTSLLILVGVALDTIAQAEGFLISQRYDRLYKVKGKASSSSRRF
jgi:preprotein translocase subunit SecY